MEENDNPTPGYDIKIDIDLSIPEEVRCHPEVQKWVELMEYRLSRTINAMSQRFGQTGIMIVPVLYTPTLKDETKEEHERTPDEVLRTKTEE